MYFIVVCAPAYADQAENAFCLFAFYEADAKEWLLYCRLFRDLCVVTHVHGTKLKKKNLSTSDRTGHRKMCIFEIQEIQDTRSVNCLICLRVPRKSTLMMRLVIIFGPIILVRPEFQLRFVITP
jgi:hypothetical protein